MQGGRCRVVPVFAVASLHPLEATPVHRRNPASQPVRENVLFFQFRQPVAGALTAAENHVCPQTRNGPPRRPEGDTETRSLCVRRRYARSSASFRRQ